MRIRRAVESDLPEIQSIARRTIDACYRPFLGDESVDWFINDGGSDQYLSENVADCRVLMSEDSIVGFCVTKNDLIDLMMVDSAVHRQGYGAAMLKDCERRLFAEFDELRLESFEGNTVANNFYRKHGWIERDCAFDEASGVNKFLFTKAVQA